MMTMTEIIMPPIFPAMSAIDTMSGHLSNYFSPSVYRWEDKRLREVPFLAKVTQEVAELSPGAHTKLARVFFPHISFSLPAFKTKVKGLCEPWNQPMSSKWHLSDISTCPWTWCLSSFITCAPGEQGLHPINTLVVKQKYKHTHTHSNHKIYHPRQDIWRAKVHV